MNFFDSTNLRRLISTAIVVSNHGFAPLLNGAAQGHQTDANTRYFRSDHGRAPGGSDPLPARLNDPSVLRWRVNLDSGQSTPILSNGRIFLTTYNSQTKELATVALDQKSGDLIWRRPVTADRIEIFHQKTGNAAVATPACDGSRLYVFFGSYGLICYDLDGKKLWEHRMGPFRDEYGAGSSPIIVDGNIILNQDHDTDSFLAAIDSSTGKLVWRTPRPDAVRSYATPVLWLHEGRKELLVAGALELAGHDPTSGKRLWSIPGLARIVIPVPVPDGDMIYMASWAPGGDAGKRLVLDAWLTALAKWDKNQDGKLSLPEVDDREVVDRFFRMDLNQDGTLDQKEWDRHANIFRLAQNALLAIRPAGRGELSESQVVWKHQRGIPYVATPLLDAGIIWMVKDGGIVTKLDAASGALLQEERLAGLGGYYASPVSGDGKVYFASEAGVVTIVANQKEWQVLSSHDFREKIYATPVIDGPTIYIRTDQGFYAFEGSK